MSEFNFDAIDEERLISLCLSFSGRVSIIMLHGMYAQYGFGAYIGGNGGWKNVIFSLRIVENKAFKRNVFSLQFFALRIHRCSLSTSWLRSAVRQFGQ